MRSPFIATFLGVAAPVTSVTVSFLSHIEAWMRLASLTVGLIVGILSVVSLFRNLRKK